MDNEFISEALKRLPLLPLEEQKVLLKMLDQYEHARKIELARTDFLTFAQLVDPNFKVGSHHRIINQVCNRIAKGELKRVIINIAPRHGKSHIMSYLFPAWYVGQHPEHKIIQATHTSDLSVDFGRKVRNLVGTEIYGKIFPKVGLSSDSKAAGKWNTNHEGEYYAVGVGGALAGRGAHLCVVDDPVSEQAVLSASSAAFEQSNNWFMSGPRQRLMPGGAICIIQCMVGDTKVLMADNSQKDLRDVRSGDVVATYDNGELKTSVVTNWRSNGLDTVYEVTTQSGIIFRANERHPFLVAAGENKQWVRLKNLRQGMLLVVLKGATDPLGRKQNRVSAIRVKLMSIITGKTPGDQSTQSGTTGSLKVNNATKKGVLHQLRVAVNAISTTLAPDWLLEKWPDLIPMLQEGEKSKVGTESLRLNTMPWLPNEKTAAIYAEKNHQQLIRHHIGNINCVLTTVTKAAEYVGYCVTHVIKWLGVEEHQKSLKKAQHTYGFTHDAVKTIKKIGKEEVFDVEILRTENFIANGVVSHNTRWATNDMTGFLVENMINNPDGDKWEVVELPMELPSGEPLWPEFWSKQDIAKLKATLPSKYWQAQYQQNPTADEGALIKREWWQRWTRADPPRCEFTISAWDTAFEKNSKADYSAMTYWGVFKNEEDDDNYHLILLDARRERIEFPELKVWARKHWMEDEPDFMVVEKKATGAPLIYEMRQMGIPIQEYTPVRGQDKVTRVNAISPLFETGRVWAPRTRWAEEVIEECAAFPNGKHDDFVDTVSLALLRMRMGGLVRAANDEDDTRIAKFKRRRTYY